MNESDPFNNSLIQTSPTPTGPAGIAAPFLFIQTVSRSGLYDFSRSVVSEVSCGPCSAHDRLTGLTGGCQLSILTSRV